MILQRSFVADILIDDTTKCQLNVIKYAPSSSQF